MCFIIWKIMDILQIVNFKSSHFQLLVLSWWTILANQSFRPLPHLHSFSTPMPGSRSALAPQGHTLAFHLSLTVLSSATVSSSEKQQKEQHAWEQYSIGAPCTPLPYSLLLFFYSSSKFCIYQTQKFHKNGHWRHAMKNWLRFSLNVHWKLAL